MSERPAPPTMAASLRHCWRLFVLARPYYGSLGKGVLLGIVASGAGVITPYLSKLYIDQVYPTRDVSFLLLLVIAAFTVTVVSAVLGAIRAFYSAVVMT